MPSEPLVTALMPVHEYRDDFLQSAVSSLVRQSSRSWRALVIVEPSRRTVFEAILATTAEDSRFRLIENEGRKLAGAFNTGMRHADTEFVAILLADDMWAPDAVAVLEREIRSRPDVDFFHSARRVIDDDGHEISSIHSARHDVVLADFQLHSPCKHLLCWRRAKGLAVGGMDESLNSIGPDDLDFPWTMAEAGATFGAIDECLYLYRDHRGHYRLTTHLPRNVQRRELARIYRKHRLPRKLARQRLRAATRSHLRQCLYRTELEKRFRQALGLEATRVWRQSYR
ncbi:MAG TPA: glycosyltransferase [Acidimicrobiia bacterium]|nr:glycosyltransferase [Acidimicrobiia bacterium]